MACPLRYVIASVAAFVALLAYIFQERKNRKYLEEEREWQLKALDPSLLKLPPSSSTDRLQHGAVSSDVMPTLRSQGACSTSGTCLGARTSLRIIGQAFIRPDRFLRTLWSEGIEGFVKDSRPSSCNSTNSEANGGSDADLGTVGGPAVRLAEASAARRRAANAS